MDCPYSQACGSSQRALLEALKPDLLKAQNAMIARQSTPYDRKRLPHCS